MKPTLLSILALGVTLACGCSREDYAEVPVHPLQGSLFIDGAPAYGAYVTFHPAANVGMTKGNKPFARVDKDGRFTVTTYNSGDGTPVGSYQVTIIWPEDPEARGPSPDRLKGRYATTDKSELSVQVDATTKELPKWELNK
ncbi:hypothetical protein SH139x_003301 [Planctomycetaceae bacterium SH139]